MLICWPGIESSTKRAATSETRCAPEVTTTYWTTTRMKKTTRPMTKLPCTAKAPIESITSPAWASVRISRVAATLSDSRNRVATSSSEGKVENSTGLLHIEGQQQDRQARSAKLRMISRSSSTRRDRREQDQQDRDHRADQDQILVPAEGMPNIRPRLSGRRGAQFDRARRRRDSAPPATGSSIAQLAVERPGERAVLDDRRRRSRKAEPLQPQGERVGAARHDHAAPPWSRIVAQAPPRNGSG